MERPRVFMWKKMIFLNKIIKRKKLKSPNLEKNDLRYLKILIQTLVDLNGYCYTHIMYKGNCFKPSFKESHALHQQNHYKILLHVN